MCDIYYNANINTKNSWREFPLVDKVHFLYTNAFHQGDELLVRLASSVVYSLMCAAAGCLDLERMGCLSVLNTLAKRCLAQDPPAQLFWAEEGEIVLIICMLLLVRSE